MSIVADVPIRQDEAQEPAAPIQGWDVDAEVEERQGDRTFRRLAPPVMSREQLRSPIATPGKAHSSSTNLGVVIQDAADDSSDHSDELLPRRRTRHESESTAAAAKTASTTAPSSATPQELVDWCIAQAISVAKLPFEQAPSSVAGQVAAFSAAFQDQVCYDGLPLCSLNHV